MGNCLECGQNKGILPWQVFHGCPKPMECEARLEIVDAWKTGNGKNKPKRWGFVGKIKIPKEVIDNNKHFSVLIRFSKKVTHGHFQLWNMNFWNFYNGGYEVLIHSKYWNTDRHDPNSVLFLAEELNSDEYPELVYWSGHQKKTFLLPTIDASRRKITWNRLRQSSSRSTTCLRRYRHLSQIQEWKNCQGQRTRTTQLNWIISPSKK